MAEIKLTVPEWLSGMGDLPTTLPGVALYAAPFVMDFFFPGSAGPFSKLVSILTGTGLILTKGDTKPPAG